MAQYMTYKKKGKTSFDQNAFNTKKKKLGYGNKKKVTS